MPDRLLALREDRRRGVLRGIPSLCSAHPLVLRAALDRAREAGGPVLVEATCNQVNQEGGYTGMRPGDFAAFLARLAREARLDPGGILLGGDHLGPNPWRREPAAAAMEKAKALVEAYVEAGFRKLHLDCSMACGGDPPALPGPEVARRAAELARTAEAAFRRRPGGLPPVYVIGTEVPVPGGTGSEEPALRPTAPEDLLRTLEETEAAFRSAGAAPAWDRVLAVVVQPGVEFGDAQVHAYDPGPARPLAEAIRGRFPYLFEAHSTDFQRRSALAALVRDGFAILKVGPALTFHCREALFALEDLAAELRRADPSLPEIRLRERLDEAMRAEPAHWEGHHKGTGAQRSLARLFSWSDRSRYYWHDPGVSAEVDRLLAATEGPLLPQLISQHLPRSLDAVLEGRVRPAGADLARHAVRLVLDDYAAACEPTPEGRP